MLKKAFGFKFNYDVALIFILSKNEKRLTIKHGCQFGRVIKIFIKCIIDMDFESVWVIRWLAWSM